LVGSESSLLSPWSMPASSHSASFRPVCKVLRTLLDLHWLLYVKFINKVEKVVSIYVVLLSSIDNACVVYCTFKVLASLATTSSQLNIYPSHNTNLT
jgi:hypothetical protein